MDKISETREFLKNIGMPKQQQADICCYVILAMAGIKPEMPWNEATNEWIRIHDIIQFANTYYGTAGKHLENRHFTDFAQLHLLKILEKQQIVLITDIDLQMRLCSL